MPGSDTLKVLTGAISALSLPIVFNDEDESIAYPHVILNANFDVTNINGNIPIQWNSVIDVTVVGKEGLDALSITAGQVHDAVKAIQITETTGKTVFPFRIVGENWRGRIQDGNRYYYITYTYENQSA